MTTDKPSSIDATAASSLEGTWSLTIKSPTGPMETSLFIERSGDALTGSQSGQGLTSPISDVKFEGNKLSWTNHVTKPMKMKLECSGVVEGKNISGKVKAGFMGTYPFFGTKQ
jgi:hypothetical protein